MRERGDFDRFDTYGYRVTNPATQYPGEPQNSWQMHVYPIQTNIEIRYVLIHATKICDRLTSCWLILKVSHYQLNIHIIKSKIHI